MEKTGMARKGDVIVAGVSGGADSVCLLFVLCALRERMGFKVKVCHVNHGIRGAEADADEAYVRQLCGKLQADCIVFHENVELIAEKRKQSLEEAGRAVRREAFEKVCAGSVRAKIATAHHRDDNAETVLLNIARGTGLRGLCGIWPARGRWIRPLMWAGRAEIERFLKEQGISWRTDATNEGDDYTRNRIRHHVVPLLQEQVNPGAVRHLDELAAQARELWEMLEQETERAGRRCICAANGQKLILDGAALSREHAAVRRQLVRNCIAQVRGDEKDISSTHVADVLGLLEKQNGRRVELPGGVRARRVYEGVEIAGPDRESQPPRGNRPDGLEREPEGLEIPLRIPGETFFRGYVISCRVVEKNDGEKPEQIPQKSYTKRMDYDIIKNGLSVRNRRPGDYLTIDAGGNRQKLKSYFINEKVPEDQRGRIPLIADGPEIAWIPGYRMGRTYYVDDSTERILEIKITEEKTNGDNQGTDPGRESR